MIGSIRSEEARKLCILAQGDASALQHPLPDSIYGFCAQQACEKSMKAWIAALGQQYPFTHNLSTLVRIIKAAGETFPIFAVPLSLLQPYAVQFRYDTGSTLTEEERSAVQQTALALNDYVLTRILEIEAAEA